MPKTIHLRNVPDDLHRKLRIRAANEGVTLSDLLIAEARRLVERPSMAEFLDRLAKRSRVTLKESPAEAVRAEREGR